MLRTWLDRLQALWVQNTRNRIVIMVSTAVLAILLLCGCLNLLGVLGSGLVNSLIASGPPAHPTFQTGTQVANINPTFPLPSPTVYPAPPKGSGTPVAASGTPPPTPTPTPTPSATTTPVDGAVTYHISPTDGVLTSGQNNTFTLSGTPGTLVVLSLQGVQGGGCNNKPVVLDGGGQGSVSCSIPGNLKNSMHTLSLFYDGQDHQYQLQVV